MKVPLNVPFVFHCLTTVCQFLVTKTLCLVVIQPFLSEVGITLLYTHSTVRKTLSQQIDCTVLYLFNFSITFYTTSSLKTVAMSFISTPLCLSRECGKKQPQKRNCQTKVSINKTLLINSGSLTEKLQKSLSARRKTNNENCIFLLIFNLTLSMALVLGNPLIFNYQFIYSLNDCS